MTDSLPSLVWRDWSGLFERAGFTRVRLYATLVNIVVIGAFGIAVPWRRGFDFFDAAILIPYAFISLLFAAAAATDVVEGNGSGARQMLARVLASALFGWCVFLVILAIGMLTVNLLYRAHHLFLPPSAVLGAAIALSMASSLCVSSFGAYLSVLFSPESAKLILRSLFIVVLLAVLFAPRFLPESTRDAIATNVTSRSLSRYALIAAGILAALSAGPIIALRYARK